MIHLELEDTSYESDIRELTAAFFPPREAEKCEISVRFFRKMSRAGGRPGAGNK